MVLDWMLPGVSGIEVCRRLRARARHRTLPIIMLTARGEEERAVRGSRNGRRRLCDQALFAARAGRARARPCCVGSGPRWPASMLTYGDLEMEPSSHKVQRGGDHRAARPDRVPPARLFPRTSRPGVLPRAAARQRLGP